MLALPGLDAVTVQTPVAMAEIVEPLITQGPFSLKVTGDPDCEVPATVSVRPWVRIMGEPCDHAPLLPLTEITSVGRGLEMATG